MSALDDLLSEIFDGIPVNARTALAPEFAAWLRESRRFKAFAAVYRAKIRAKLKNARGDDGVKDLRAELETAVLFLRDDRFTLEYEKFAASKQRAPDFTVTYKTHTPFNVEVRRFRPPADSPVPKLVEILCDKVGQMPPSVVNLLWLTADSAAEQPLSDADLDLAAGTLRELAERKVEEFFTRRGYDSAADFLKHYRQLSGIVLRQNGSSSLWLNPLARHKPPPDLLSALNFPLSM